MEQARQEVEQARELIDDVLFLGELETGREVVSLGRTRVQPIVEEVVAGYTDRADNAQVAIEVRADDRVELPVRRGCCGWCSRTCSRTRSGMRGRAPRAPWRCPSPTRERCSPSPTTARASGGE